MCEILIDGVGGLMKTFCLWEKNGIITAVG